MKVTQLYRMKSRKRVVYCFPNVLIIIAIQFIVKVSIQHLFLFIGKIAFKKFSKYIIFKIYS